MRGKKEFKERSKMLRRERKIKLEQRRSGVILENSPEFIEASLRGEEHPVLVSAERVKLWQYLPSIKDLGRCRKWHCSFSFCFIRQFR